ncbi:MAG: DUF2147 domain-containing protein [Aquidulcibacter sp.]|jgi:uncharacterized protein (DUF2147 family)|uniref:DUF2147 domain-containing protein n=1 Tax=Aquidulcibacter sp. TaxID=2052990 RepID=UPI0022C17A7E|nr:DUF2147 domain-containing protein [Aquidulcibacter sp.]
MKLSTQLTAPALLAFMVATPSFASELHGTRWLTANGSGIIRIEACGKQTCGRIVGPGPKADKNAATTDTKNPDPKLRTRSIVGMAILTGFTAQPDGKFTGGQIYDPTEGKVYRSEFRRKRDGKLEVKGCVGPICIGQTWTPAT